MTPGHHWNSHAAHSQVLIPKAKPSPRLHILVQYLQVNIITWMFLQAQTEEQSLTAPLCYLHIRCLNPGLCFCLPGLCPRAGPHPVLLHWEGPSPTWVLFLLYPHPVLSPHRSQGTFPEPRPGYTIPSLQVLDTPSHDSLELPRWSPSSLAWPQGLISYLGTTFLPSSISPATSRLLASDDGTPSAWNALPSSHLPDEAVLVIDAARLCQLKCPSVTSLPNLLSLYLVPPPRDCLSPRETLSTFGVQKGNYLG